MQQNGIQQNTMQQNVGQLQQGQQLQMQQNGQFVQPQTGQQQQPAVANGNVINLNGTQNINVTQNNDQQTQNGQVDQNGQLTTTGTETSTAEISESKLNAEVAEFVPTNFGGQDVQQSVQEQLFNQLQSLGIQIQQHKHHIQNVINVGLIDVASKLMFYQQQPHLLNQPQHSVLYWNLQQNQQQWQFQLNATQQNLIQLEANLKYAQERYQQNKDEQYKVVPDEEFNALLAAQQNGGVNVDGNNDENVNNNINDTQSGTTYNLTDAVTDVGGNVQLPQQNQLILQQQEQTNVSFQPSSNELNNNNSQQPGGIVANNDNNVILNGNGQSNEQLKNGDNNNDTLNNGQNDEALNLSEGGEINSEKDNEINVVSNGIKQIKLNGDDVLNNTEQQPEIQEKPAQDVRVKFMDYVESIKEKDEDDNPSRFNNNNKSTPQTPNKFVYGRSAPESPPSSSSKDDPRNNDELDNYSESQSVSPRKFGDTLKPHQSMDRLQSFESNGSRFKSDDNDNFDVYDQTGGDDEKKGKEIIGDRYDVMQLIKLQKNHMSVNWSSSLLKNIPRSVRLHLRLPSGYSNDKYMEDVVAMFMRKSSNPWLAASHTGKAPKDRKEKCIKKLTGVLNKMTPEKFTKIAKQTLDIVNEYAETKDQMEVIVGLVLKFGIKQPVFGSQYAELCNHLYDYLNRLRMVCEFEWVIQDKDLSKTFRNMVIQQTNDLFTTHRNHSPPDIHLDEDGKKIMDEEYLELKISKKKDNFFAVMILVAELYNVELIKKNLVYKGLFEVLLPPQNTKLSAIDLEGLCRLLKRCGKKLDEQGERHVSKYLQKLQSHARKFDFRTKVLVDEVNEMRSNGWKHRLKKETAKTKEEIRDEFEKEQAEKERPKYDQRGGRGGGRNDYRDDRGGRGNGRKNKYRDNRYNDEDYDDYYDDYNNNDDYQRGSHGYSTSNLKPLPTKDRYKEKNYDRSSRRSQSSRNLRKVGNTSSRSRYNDQRSWGDDSQNNGGGGNGRYGNKFDKQEMSQSKSYGMYKKKESSKPRHLLRTKSDSAFSVTSNESDYSRSSINGASNGHSTSKYGEGDKKKKIK